MQPCTPLCDCAASSSAALPPSRGRCIVTALSAHVCSDVESHPMWGASTADGMPTLTISAPLGLSERGDSGPCTILTRTSPYSHSFADSAPVVGGLQPWYICWSFRLRFDPSGSQAAGPLCVPLATRELEHAVDTADESLSFCPACCCVPIYPSCQSNMQFLMLKPWHPTNFRQGGRGLQNPPPPSLFYGRFTKELLLPASRTIRSPAISSCVTLLPLLLE